MSQKLFGTDGGFTVEHPGNQQYIRMPDTADQGDAKALQVVPGCQCIEYFDVAVITGAAGQVENIQ